MADPLIGYVITEHARLEMGRRGLSEEIVRQVLTDPERRREVRAGREVLQRRLAMGDPAKVYLIQVFADTDRSPAEVVTAYRTSRISRYWRD